MISGVIRIVETSTTSTISLYSWLRISPINVIESIVNIFCGGALESHDKCIKRLGNLWWVDTEYSSTHSHSIYIICSSGLGPHIIPTDIFDFIYIDVFWYSKL